jgi:hypothetical protein
MLVLEFKNDPGTIGVADISEILAKADLGDMPVLNEYSAL